MTLNPFQFAALGGFILMFGFLAFNGGSAGEISAPGTGNMVALAMTNTILCGALAALTYLLIHYAANGKWTCLLTINAALTGMVAVCAGCNIMMPWACVFTGPGAGIIYLWLSKLVVKLKIDDPLDAFAVHAGGGAWGLIAARIIGKGGVAYAIVGAIDGSENSGHAIAAAFVALGWQCVCAIAIVLWSISVMIPVFWVLKKLGKLRVSPEVEIKGLDIFKHGEAAYPIHAYGHGWDELDLKSMKQEISIEELADAYERKTSVLPRIDTRKLSFYHNRDRFEHPEKHMQAMNNGTSPVKVSLSSKTFVFK